MIKFPPINLHPFSSDSGAPYFYKARPTKAPYVLTNPIIGKALALDFLYGYRFTLAVKQKVNSYKPKEVLSPGKANNLKKAETPVYKSPVDSVSYNNDIPNIVDVSKKIAIWLWDDFKNQEAGGVPYLYLDFIPKELKFDVASSLRPLGIVGANYPHLHYTGSHETLTMSISWYDTMADQDRVAVKCRKLEALSKADGYGAPPPKIFIDWGHWESQVATASYAQDYDTLLGGHVYTVQSANYELKDFLQHRVSNGKDLYGKQAINEDPFIAANSKPTKALIIGNKLRPLHATQELVLKREAVQLTHKQIIHGTI